MKSVIEALNERHAVRSYTNQVLEGEIVSALKQKIEHLNTIGDLHIQLIINEPSAFGGWLSKIVKFSGVRNYFLLVGKTAANLEEKLGYYGQQLVLYAQQLGLNTCWAMTFSKTKGAYSLANNEKVCLAIAVGYGNTQGVPHTSKAKEEVSNIDNQSPQWFIDGVKAALLAPTGHNKQKFRLELNGNQVHASTNNGFLNKVALGIVKCQFEIAAGKDSSIWK